MTTTIMQGATKRRLLTCSIFSIVVWSCYTHKEDCVKTKSEELKVYSEILNMLVEKGLYNSYLQGVYDYNSKSIEIPQDEIIELREELADDPQKECWLFMDSALRPLFNTWDYHLQSNNEAYIQIRDVINSVSKDGQVVIDQLNSMQTKYTPDDFEVCYFDFKPLDSVALKHSCEIGAIAFSNIVFNSTIDKALLYYQFRCGEFCGKGELLLLEKKNNRWSVLNIYAMYLS